MIFMIIRFVENIQATSGNRIISVATVLKSSRSNVMSSELRYNL